MQFSVLIFIYFFNPYIELRIAMCYILGLKEMSLNVMLKKITSTFFVIQYNILVPYWLLDLLVNSF